MLIKLLPDQIARRWDFIYETIRLSLPPITTETLDLRKNLLQSFLIGEMECWAVHEIEDGEQKVYGFVVTTIVEDYIAETRDLLIYSFYMLGEKIGKDFWKQGLLTLLKYAKSKNCRALTAYTENEGLIKFGKRMGAETQTYTYFPIRG